jgi:hypothetical protein
MRRPSRPIRRAEPLGHDALATELTGFAENDLAVFFEMLIEHDA